MPGRPQHRRRGAALPTRRRMPSGTECGPSRCGSRWTTASAWRPRSIARTRQGPFPALLESIPYRKDDWTLTRDWPLHGAFAAAGYVSCRLDVRGTGSSEGVAEGEYPEREILDNLAVIDWLATRAWSTGGVGMFGISWGGFSALQAAARRPAALRAIIPVHFSHDRYNLDVHYVGGTLHVGESVYWPVEMVGENALPPDPERFGPGWREEWLRRLEATPQWPLRVAAPPAPRPVLAGRIDRRGVGGDRGSGPRDRRAQRRLPGRGPRRAGARPGAPARRHRAVGARLAARWLAGAVDRRCRPDATLVGPLAQGRGRPRRRGPRSRCSRSTWSSRPARPSSRPSSPGGGGISTTGRPRPGSRRFPRSSSRATARPASGRSPGSRPRPGTPPRPPG